MYKTNINSSTLKVLLVEDNRINQEVAIHILNKLEINVDIAINGLEAIKLLQASLLSKPYDIVLMDCHMPVMDGYEATQAIRCGDAGEKNKAIIIIAMTANTMLGDEEKCIASGMNDYLSKPIEPKRIKEKIALYTNRTDPKQLISSPSSAELKKEETVNVTSETNEDKSALKKPSDHLVIWREDEFTKRISNNLLIKRKLIEFFLTDAPKQIAALSISIIKGNDKEQYEISHRLQGMTGNLSAEVLLYKILDFNHYLRKTIQDQAEKKYLLATIQTSYLALEEVLKASLNEGE